MTETDDVIATIQQQQLRHGEHSANQTKVFPLLLVTTSNFETVSQPQVWTDGAHSHMQARQTNLDDISDDDEPIQQIMTPAAQRVR